MTRDALLGCVLFPVNLVLAIVATGYWIVRALLTPADES